MIRDIDRALLSYPLLKRVDKNGFIHVVGEIQLIHPVKGEFDKYCISVFFPFTYPSCFPKVKETGSKIPKIASRHVNYDGTLCLAVEPEEKIITKNGIQFKYFLDKILVPHLARETFREITGRYPEGEYAHGNEGIWEYYESILETKDRKSILIELERIACLEWQGRNELCFCGSSQKFKNCHLKRWNIILKSGRDYTNEIIKTLKADINNE